MSDPTPPPVQAGGTSDEPAGEVVPVTGTYEARNRSTGSRLGRRRLVKGTRFPGWSGCARSDVIWSSRPVRALLEEESEEPGGVADNAAVTN